MSSELDDLIKHAYDKFWSKRDEVKKRQRQELEDETRAERLELAQAIWSARRSNEKYTVQDVADVLGLSNRNFLYKVLNDLPLNDPNAATKPVGRPSAAAMKKTDIVKSAPFHLMLDGLLSDGKSVKVTIRNKGIVDGWNQYDLVLDDTGHIIDIPEDWYLDTLEPDEVEFYKNLIQTIEKGE